MKRYELFIAAAAASVLGATSAAFADSTTKIIEEGPKRIIQQRPAPAPEDAEGRGADVNVEQWTEDGKLKKEIHYGNGCRKSVQKDLVTGDEKVVYHEGCTEEEDD